MADELEDGTVERGQVAAEVCRARVGLLVLLLLGAVQAGEDLGAVLGQALGDTADLVGSIDGMVAPRPGSWESTHVYALAFGYARVASWQAW